MLKSAVGAQGIVEGGVGATVVEKAEKVGLVIADDLARAVDAPCVGGDITLGGIVEGDVGVDGHVVALRAAYAPSTGLKR